MVGRRERETQDPSDDDLFVGRLDELAIDDPPLSAENVRHHFRLIAKAIAQK